MTQTINDITHPYLKNIINNNKTIFSMMDDFFKHPFTQNELYEFNNKIKKDIFFNFTVLNEKHPEYNFSINNQNVQVSYILDHEKNDKYKAYLMDMVVLNQSKKYNYYFSIKSSNIDFENIINNDLYQVRIKLHNKNISYYKYKIEKHSTENFFSEMAAEKDEGFIALSHFLSEYYEDFFNQICAQKNNMKECYELYELSNDFSSDITLLKNKNFKELYLPEKTFFSKIKNLFKH